MRLSMRRKPIRIIITIRRLTNGPIQQRRVFCLSAITITATKCRTGMNLGLLLFHPKFARCRF